MDEHKKYRTNMLCSSIFDIYWGCANFSPAYQLAWISSVPTSKFQVSNTSEESSVVQRRAAKGHRATVKDRRRLDGAAGSLFTTADWTTVWYSRVFGMGSHVTSNPNTHSRTSGTALSSPKEKRESEMPMKNSGQIGAITHFKTQ